MITQDGKLKVGVEVDGKVHIDFTLRPRLVRDSIEAQEVERAQTNPAYDGLVLTCKEIIKLGDLTKEQITPDLLMEMHDIDMQEILGAAEKLRARLATFREESQVAAPAADSADEGRVLAS
jgi:hypothetical protein